MDISKLPLITRLEAVTVIVASLFATAALAAGTPTKAQTDAVRSACRSDYASNCGSIPPGGAASLQCLQKNVAKLSSSCQQAVNALGGGEAAPAVTAPAAAPATAAPAAAPATAAPTAKPAADAAAAPAATPSTPTQAQSEAIRSACAADYQSNCPGIEPGGAAAWTCLQTNVKKFSQPCQDAVNAVTGPAAAPAGKADTASGAAAAPAAPAVPTVVMAPMPPLPLRVQLRLLRADCSSDFKALCKGIALGEGRAITCLVSNAASLTPQCRSAMEALRR
jgi:hypothetical protein